MGKKSWHLDRRTFLLGAGVSCLLPQLEAMTPSLKGDAPKRFAFVYFPNGACLPNLDKKNPANNEKIKQLRWFPQETGSHYEATMALKPVQPFREDCTILGGLSHPKSRKVLGHLAGDSFLTAGDLRGEYRNRMSFDQYLAEKVGSKSRYPFFSFSADGGVGYPSRAATLSFNRMGNAVPTEHRHRIIFERYFTEQGSAEERRKQLASGKRMVDLVLESSRRLKHRLGKKDQNTMAQYLETLSSVEKQIEINEAWLDTPLKKVKGSKPMLDVDPKEGCENYIKSMFDLMALGFHMDLTRVMTFQMAREDGMGFGDAYPVLASGAKKGHHGLSHSKDMEGYTEWSTHDAWLAERFAGFLKELKTREDEHGSLLDNTQVLFGSSQTHTHNASDMPLILAGGKNMGLKHGHYERFPEKVHMTNLLVSMAQAAGLDCDRFADSNGTCPGKTFS